MEEINTIYADMPTTIRSYVVANNDNTYTIVLNSRLSREQHLISYYHERNHITNRDYEKKGNVGLIEIMTHTV